MVRELFLLKLSLKNLLRHKRRTLLTASALSVGLIMYLLLDSLLTGMFSASNNNLKDAETGDGKIITQAAFEEVKFLPIGDRVKDPEYIISIVEGLGGSATKRVLINGDMIFSRDYFSMDGSSPILFTAVDIENDNSVFNIFHKKFLVAGRFLEPGRDEVVIGSWLAEDTGADVGDWFTLSLRTAPAGDDPGFFQTIDVEVVGIVKVENPMINRRVVYFPMDMADYYLDLSGSVTEVAVRIPVGEKLNSFREKINPLLPHGIRFYTWKEIAFDYVKLLEGETGGSAIILILIVLIGVVGVTNTMLMTINERQQEIGMMRALGMSSNQVKAAFLYEAAGIGLVGGVIGVVLGAIINIPIVNYGIDYSEFMRNTDMGYKISAYMKGAWNFSSFLVAFIAGVLTPVIVSIIPAKRAIKKSIPATLSGR